MKDKIKLILFCIGMLWLASVRDMKMFSWMFELSTRAGVACLLGMIIVLYLYWRRKEKRKEVAPMREEAVPLEGVNSTMETETSEPQTGGRIKVDWKNRFVYIDGEDCTFTNMEFELFSLFLKAPNHYLSREDIRLTFWPKEDNVENRINTHITNLRNILKAHEGIELAGIRGKGYRLVCS